MDNRAISGKLSQARLGVLNNYPFFGRLLLKLRFGVAQCGTAFTDMRRIVFDPDFAMRLSQQELEYVLVHEVLHCALKHCTRGGKKHPFIYNVACDIVVNSTMLEMFDVSEIIIDGHSIMHLTPDGDEGREYTAEQVYCMMLKLSDKELEDYSDANTDNHDAWGELDAQILEDLWSHHLKDVSRATSHSGKVPQFLERYLVEVDRSPRTNWRQVLHDFVQFDKSDYDFSLPDKRFSSEMILPSFCENQYGQKVENVWLFADTSGSITDKMLSVCYQEVRLATEQIDNLSGVLWFFDAAVYGPHPFDSPEGILSAKVKGGGGTNFAAIFEKLKEYENDLPTAIVILTDGYDCFPDESVALGVPVIWIIVDSEVIPPWGTYTFIST